MAWLGRPEESTVERQRKIIDRQGQAFPGRKTTTMGVVPLPQKPLMMSLNMSICTCSSFTTEALIWRDPAPNMREPRSKASPFPLWSSQEQGNKGEARTITQSSATMSLLREQSLDPSLSQHLHHGGRSKKLGYNYHSINNTHTNASVGIYEL